MWCDTIFKEQINILGSTLIFLFWEWDEKIDINHACVSHYISVYVQVKQKRHIV